MAEDKKTIVVYSDWIKKFEALEDDEAGRLIKHFFRYVNDKNPTAPDRITALSFIDIESTLKRDLKKWEKRAERSRENGKLGGRPAQNNPEKPKETQQVILEPRKPDSVNGIVNVNEINNISRNEKFRQFNLFWEKYPNKVSKKKAEEKFMKLKQAEIDLIFSTLDDFILHKPFPSYSLPNPSTYLIGKRWEDEIVTITENDKFNHNYNSLPLN